MGVLGGVGLLDGGLCKAPFEDLPAVDFLFYSATGDESIHHHMALLPDSERPVYALAATAPALSPFETVAQEDGAAQNSILHCFPGIVYTPYLNT